MMPLAIWTPDTSLPKETIETGYRPLHDWMPIIEPLHDSMRKFWNNREVAKPDPTLYRRHRYQVLYMLSDPSIRFYRKSSIGTKRTFAAVRRGETLDLTLFDRVYQGNDFVQPYDAMGLGNMAATLIQGARWCDDADHKMLIALGLAFSDVVTDETNEGGLRRQKDGCSWFHAHTNAKSDGYGRTLNKHLSATRDLWQAAQVLRQIDAQKHKGDIQRLERAALEGVKKMVDGAFPTLMHFIPEDRKGNRIKRSWLYYGITWGGDKGYFLDRDYKNGNYHLFVMRLIARLFKMMGDAIPRKEWKRERGALGDRSIPEWIWETYKAKEKAGLYKDTATDPPGNFDALDREFTEPLDASDRKFWSDGGWR